MNTFKDVINEQMAAVKKNEKLIVRYSKRLQSAMGLTDLDLKNAMEYRISWTVALKELTCKIIAEHIIYDEWMDMLLVRPSSESQGLEHGWIWANMGKTNEMCLPPQTIQDEIIETIGRLRREKEV